MGSDYYSLLGLTNDATPEEIRRSYFDAARRLHPDATPDAACNELFLKVQQAYEVLSNAKARAEYDASVNAEYRVQPEITVSLYGSRSIVSRMGEPQLYYVLMDLACGAEQQQPEPPPANICLVIDRSTSMQGSRMDMVKASISQLLKNLRPKDMLSVVAFSDRAELIVPPTRGVQAARLDNQIYGITCRGGTEIYQGLRLGYDQLSPAGDAGELRQLYLITDGHTYGDEQACIALAEQAALEGIAIHALGIGHEWNDQFLDRLAASAGGSTTFVTGKLDMARFLEDKLKAFAQVYARSLSLAFRRSPEVELRYAFRLHPEVTPLTIASPIALGDLLYGKNLTVLFEFLVGDLAPAVDSLQFLNGVIKMELIQPAAAKGRVFVDLKRQVRPVAEPETPPPAIVEALSRITLYRLQEKARAEVVTGDIGGATRHLQFLATHLIQEGNHDLAHCVLQEAEQIRQNQAFSKDGDKRIKYGTRALMLPARTEEAP